MSDETVRVAVWVMEKFCVAKVYTPISASVIETRSRVMKWADDNKAGGIVVDDELDQHFYMFLRKVVREMLEATGHEMDWQETSFLADFGSHTCAGNLWQPGDPARAALTTPNNPPGHETPPEA